MSDIAYRQVQRNNDPFGIPACFYWTVDEVADWVESIGYGKYKENFRSHFINGRKLLTVDACVLPKLGIVNFGDILDVSGNIQNLLCSGRMLRYKHPSLETPFRKDFTYNCAPRDGLHAEYRYMMWYPRRERPTQPWMTYPEYLADPLDEKPDRGRLYSLTSHGLAGSIKSILGKGIKTPYLHQHQGNRFYPPIQHHMQQEARQGRDVDYNWRLWVPEYYSGYLPKASPVTNADFVVRWCQENNTYKLLRAPLQCFH